MNNKTYIFQGTDLVLPDGSEVDVLYIHKGFIFFTNEKKDMQLIVAVGDVGERLIQDGNSHELEDDAVIELLDEILGDRTAESELAKIAKQTGPLN